jgi:hypothetical protein
VRRPDEEPVRPDDAASAPVGRRPGGRLLPPLVVAGAAVVVLSTAAEGRVHVTPILPAGTPKPAEQAPGPLPTAASPPPPAAPLDAAADSVVQTVLLVLACIVALVVAAVLIRLLVSAIRNRTRCTGPKRLRGAGAGVEPEVADAPAVLRGIAAALVAIDEHREPSDAVVQAWLGLQQAAEDAGFARSAAETPTEFTGRVLTRTGADRAALGTLLRLYLRARFGDGAITPADIADARDALRALEASWERGTVVSGA